MDQGQSFGASTTSFGGINLLRLEETLSAVHLRLARVVIEHLDWAKCLTKYDRAHTLFLADPPYWRTEGYGTEFGLEQYQQMADAMASVQGKVVLTINDHRDIRAIFDPLFEGQSIGIQYLVGGASKPKAAKELIYCSWVPAKSRKPSVRLS